MNETEVTGIALGALLGLIILALPLVTLGFRVICAWCGLDLGPFRGEGGDSHGIYEECAEELLSDE